MAGAWEEYEDTKGRLAIVNSPVNRPANSLLPYGQGFAFEYDRAGRLLGRLYRETDTSTPWRDATYPVR